MTVILGGTLLAVVLGPGVWYLGATMTPRQLVVRAVAETQMRELAGALEAHQRHFGVSAASIGALASAGLLTVDQATSLEEDLVFVGGPEMVAYRGRPCRAVAAGEPWGGPGEVPDRGLPEARLVLFAGGRLEWVPEADFVEITD